MNLELIETSALLDELMHRFDHAIFSGMKVNEQNEQKYEVWRKVGNSRTCQGLACGMIRRCEDYLMAAAEPTTGDDSVIGPPAIP